MGPIYLIHINIQELAPKQSFETNSSLDEFKDELDAWVVDTLKNIGCDTAKSVLELPIEDLVSRTDLEEETIKEVIRILKSEFE